MDSARQLEALVNGQLDASVNAPCRSTIVGWATGCCGCADAVVAIGSSRATAAITVSSQRRTARTELIMMRSLKGERCEDATTLSPRPNPNLVDNLSGTSPYIDSGPGVRARFPQVVSVRLPADPTGQPGLGGDVPHAGNPRAGVRARR